MDKSSRTCQFRSIAKTTFDDLPNGKVDETIIQPVQAVRCDEVAVCKNANLSLQMCKTVCYQSRLLARRDEKLVVEKRKNCQ